MLKFVLGPVLIGALYLAGSIYGASADQLVRKDPGTVYAAVYRAIDANAKNGTMRFDGAERPIPYTLQVDGTPDRSINVKVLIEGRQAAEAQTTLTPEDSGQSTLLSVRVDADNAVLREALAGTSKAKLAYAADWMFNIGLKKPLKQLAAEIEQGGAVGASMGDYLSPADWESQLPVNQREQVQEWRQYEATRPTTDPNAAARAYLGNGN